MKKLRNALIAIGILALAVVAALAYQYLSLNKAYAKRLIDYRADYAEQIANLVAGSASPESSSDIHAFLSGETLNQVLEVLVGPRFPLSEKVALELAKLSFSVDEGTPMIALHGHLHFVGSASSIEVRGIATFAPIGSADGGFTTRLHIVALEPTVKSSRTQLALKGFFGDMVKAIGQEQLDKLPAITLPVRQEVVIQVKGSELPVSFKTRPPNNDTLHGTLSFDGFDLKSTLKLNQAIFFEDGLHLFLQEEATSPPPAEDPAWQALSTEDRLKTLSEPTTAYFARIQLDAVNRLISKVTSLAKEDRTVSFVSTRLDGNLYYWSREHRDPIFKRLLFREEKKAHLEHPDSVKADVEVISLALEPRTDALVGLKLKAALNGKVQVHWHFDPGPSGGVGGNVGITVPRKEHELSGSIRLTEGPSPSLEAKLDGPDSIKVDVSVGLGNLGQVNLDQTVDLPKTPLFTAPMPTGLQETVRFKIGDAVIQRKVTLSDIAVSRAHGALVVSGKVSLEQAP